MGSDTDKSSDPRRKDDPAASPAPVAPDQTLDLAAILDLPAVTALLHSFWELTGMLAAIVDRHGRVLVQVGWQQICTDFHRCHPTSRENCRASDTILAQIPSAGSYQTYRCKNGLWDSSAPIMVAGQHLGNIYFGQFIFSDEEADRDFFRHQARRYGFDEAAYLAALDRVPRYDRDTVDRLMAFYARLGEMIAEIVSGGDVDQGSFVSEQWLLDMERKAFLELLNHPKTQERIMGMMQTGKPVRN